MSSEAPGFSNGRAEFLIRTRYPLAFILLIPLGLVLGAIVLPLEREPVQIWRIGFLLVAVPALVVMMLGLGYLTGRAIVFLSVPRTISIGKESIVGNFGRTGWSGPPLREIRFEDIQAIRKARIVRVPVVIGRPDYLKVKPIRDAALFYLTAENASRVEEALSTQKYHGRAITNLASG